MRISRHALTSCPTCGRPINAASGVFTDVRPEPGDFSMCTTCGELLRYREDLSVRKCEPLELNDPGLLNAERTVLVQISRRVRARWQRANAKEPPQ